MTAQEAHIELDLALQRISSFDTSEILPQEKDWFINNEALKFVSQRTNPKSNAKGQGFEDTIKRLEDLKDLITVKSFPVIDKGSSGYINLLPDYLNYVGSESILKSTCDNILSNVLPSRKIVFNFDADLTLGLDIKVSIIRDDNSETVVFNTNNLPDGYIEGVDKRELFLVNNAFTIQFQDYLNEHFSNSYLYWQNFNSNFYNNHFILSTDSDIKGIKVTINGSDSIFDFVDESFNSYGTVLSSPAGKVIAKNDIIEHQFFTDSQNSVLSKSTSKKVNSRIQGSVLEVFYPVGYVISQINLIYVCKPSKMDIYLNRNLNFEYPICKEIISNTARYLKAILSDSNYQAYIQENSLIE